MVTILIILLSTSLAFLIGIIGNLLCGSIVNIWDTVLGTLFGDSGLILTAIDNAASTQGIWNVAVTTASTLETGIAVSLTVVFIYVDLVQASASLIDMKRAEHVFKSLIRACITIWIVKNCTRLLRIVFSFFLGLAGLVSAGSGGISIDQVQSNIASAVQGTASGIYNLSADALQAVVDALIGPSLFLIFLLVAFVLCIYTCISCTIDIALRWIRLIIHFAVAPIFLCTIASKQLSFIAKQFLKSFSAVSLEIFFCVLIYHMCNGIYIVLDNVLMAGTMTGTGTGEEGLLAALFQVGDDSTLAAACGQLLLLCIVFLIFNTSIKKVGQLTAGLTGLQAGN